MQFATYSCGPAKSLSLSRVDLLKQVKNPGFHGVLQANTRLSIFRFFTQTDADCAFVTLDFAPFQLNGEQKLAESPLVWQTS